MSHMSNLHARQLDTAETTAIPAPGTLSPALANGLARILAVAAQAAMQGRTDADLVAAIGEIQQACFVAEMEFYGDDTEPVEADVPF